MNLILNNRPHHSVPPTHYGTQGGMRSEYLLRDGEWWLLAGRYQQIKAPHDVTPMGEVERLRVWTLAEMNPVKKEVVKSKVVSDIYNDRKYKGD